MSPEEFERLKQAEKEHLRKLREIKAAGRAGARQQSLTRAIEDIARAGGDPEGTREEMLERLTMDAARNEARMEMALEAAAEREAAERRAAEAERFEAEDRQRRAQDLVHQMKLQMGGAGAPTAKTRRAEEPAPDPTKAPDERPEKTIGRM